MWCLPPPAAHHVSSSLDKDYMSHSTWPRHRKPNHSPSDQEWNITRRWGRESRASWCWRCMWQKPSRPSSGCATGLTNPMISRQMSEFWTEQLALTAHFWPLGAGCVLWRIWWDQWIAKSANQDSDRKNKSGPTSPMCICKKIIKAIKMILYRDRHKWKCPYKT